MGCSDAPDEANQAPPPDTATGVVPDPTMAVPPPRDTTKPDLGVGDPSQGAKLLVTITEDSIRISHIQVAVGHVTFILENRGTQPHALEVSWSVGGRWRTPPVKPGGTTIMSVALNTGLYEAYCPMKHGRKTHRDEGVRLQFIAK